MCSIFRQSVLLRKIALPYPRKCLLGFVEAKRGDHQEYFKNYACSRGEPRSLV